MAEIKKAVLGSVRLDSDVWGAVRAMPESLNKYLRRNLLPDETVAILTGPGNTITRTTKLIEHMRKPLLKPSQKG